MRMDTNIKKRHIARQDPYANVPTTYGDVPLYKTLCGLGVCISLREEKNPNCKTCIAVQNKVQSPQGQALLPPQRDSKAKPENLQGGVQRDKEEADKDKVE